MRVVKCNPGEAATICDISGNLDSLQEAVSGYIEALYPWEDEAAIICNEEGKINGMEFNRALRDDSGAIYDIIAGPFVIVGLTADNFGELTEAQAEHYKAMFARPEAFLPGKNGIVSIKL